MTSYSGQGFAGLVSTDLLVLAGCRPDDELVLAMWPAVAAGDLPSLLMVLTSRGVPNLPDFAVVQVRDGGVLALVRGAITVAGYRAGALLGTVVAGAVTTWKEAALSDVDRVVLTGATETSGSSLPLSAGVVIAGQLDHPIRPATFLPVEAAPATREWIEPGPPAILDRLSFVDHSVPEPVAVRVAALLGEIRVESRYGDTMSARPAAGTPALFGAVRCPKLHLNPTATPACRECQVPLDPGQEPIRVPQPVVGLLRRIDTGQTWPLARPFTMIGKAPATIGVFDGMLPVVVAGSPPSISDLHAEIRLTGWRVEVFDRSANGTFVINPGDQVVRLEPGSPMRLLLGGRIVLANEVTFEFEVN